MKVVLFWGEFGMRMRNSVEDGTPTLMQMVGPRPLIWPPCGPPIPCPQEPPHD